MYITGGHVQTSDKQDKISRPLKSVFSLPYTTRHVISYHIIDQLQQKPHNSRYLDEALRSVNCSEIRCRYQRLADAEVVSNKMTH